MAKTKFIRKVNRHLYAIAAKLSLGAVLLFILLPFSSAEGQGNIFGTVTRSDLSQPADSSLVFFGFINDTDNELHLSLSSTGAGYENGNWFDDFQNYNGKAPGLPYDFYFFDYAFLQAAHLEDTIPSNSFQQKDVQLAASSWPGPPGQLKAVWADSGLVRLTWLLTEGLSYHVYRRSFSSEGSFFRIDDPIGDLSGTAVTANLYYDSTAVDTAGYAYIVIATDVAGQFSPPSPIVFPQAGGCCVGFTGNVNADPLDEVNVLDIVVLINHLFITFEELPCAEEANIEGDSEGLVDIRDLVHLINSLFITFEPTSICQ